ncbi:hypothetical protein AGDE_15689 [Angomonas deanei]|nr:hypothetical protein AGDE_15689 [Angomonas deanei]|eukprot:EPY18643.1 hypothetical protein AGDE_15689 [Angomonas deanei]
MLHWVRDIPLRLLRFALLRREWRMLTSILASTVIVAVSGAPPRIVRPACHGDFRFAGECIRVVCCWLLLPTLRSHFGGVGALLFCRRTEPFAPHDRDYLVRPLKTRSRAVTVL